MKSIISLLMALTLCLLGMVAGCTPAKKPVPSTPPSSFTTPAPRVKNVTPIPTPTTARQTGDRVVGEATKVGGVRSATVVISAKTAFIGLALNTGVTQDRTNAIKSEVASKVKRSEPDLITVNVTSDPDLVQRLRGISNGIKSGKPLTSFTSELTEIARRLKPQMSS